jgi:hypothetical protein
MTRVNYHLLNENFIQVACYKADTSVVAMAIQLSYLICSTFMLEHTYRLHFANSRHCLPPHKILSRWQSKYLALLMTSYLRLSKTLADTSWLQHIYESRSAAVLYQRLSVAIRQGNAACVLRTLPKSAYLEELFYLYCSA